MQCKAPFSDREVAQHWDAQCFAEYPPAGDDVWEREIGRQAEAKAPLKMEAMRSELATMQQDTADGKLPRVSRPQLHIAKTILVLKCQRGSAAVVNFHACLAVKGNHCTGHFCAWGRQDCGTGEEGGWEKSHKHVVACQKAPRNRRGGVYGNMKEFNQVPATDRKHNVTQYLPEQVDWEDQEDVKLAIRNALADIDMTGLYSTALPHILLPLVCLVDFDRDSISLSPLYITLFLTYGYIINYFYMIFTIVNGRFK